MAPYSDTWDDTDEIYFEEFQHIIPPPVALKDPRIIDVEAGDAVIVPKDKMEMLFEELIKRLEEQSRAQQRANRPARPTAALYVGRRVKPEE